MDGEIFLGNEETRKRNEWGEISRKLGPEETRWVGKYSWETRKRRNEMDEEIFLGNEETRKRDGWEDIPGKRGNEEPR